MKSSAIFAMLLSAAVVGCSPLSRHPAPALHDFGPTSAQTGMPVTSVAVEAPDWLKDPRIHYRLLYADPTRVRFYADNRWLAPPPDLLAQRLAAAGAGRPYRLRIRLREFEQVFDTPDRARIVLGIVARAESLEHGEFVAERRFDFALSTSSPDAQGAVQAFSTAVDQAAGEIGAWLESLANRPGQPASPAP